MILLHTKRKMGARTLGTLTHASSEQPPTKEDESRHARSAQRLSSAHVQTVE